MRAGFIISCGRRFLANDAGASAVEYALVLPALIFLTLGTINGSLLIYTVTNLNFATQNAARCATVTPTVCSATGIQAHAAANYGGLTAAPVFTLTLEPATSSTCPSGNFVSATATYKFVTGISTTNIPVAANACYPLP